MTDPPIPNDSTTEKPPETEASSIPETAMEPQEIEASVVSEAVEPEQLLVTGESAFTAEDVTVSTEAVESYSLTEALRENIAPPTYNGSVWGVVVIEEGLSKNGNLYPREVLEKSLPLWENVDVCAYGWSPRAQLDHVPLAVESSFPEGTYANKAGFLRNVTGRVSESGRYQVVAEFAVTHPTIRAEMLETHNMGGRLPGFSIHAFCPPPERGIHNGRQCAVVSAISSVKELTIVSKPAAGGRTERLVAAETTTSNPEEKTQMNLQKIRAFVASKQPPAMHAMVNEMEAAPLCESAAQLLEMDKGASKLVKLAITLLSNGKVEEAIQALELAMEEEATEAPVAEPEAEVEMPIEDPMMVAESEALKEAREIRKEIALDKCAQLLDRTITESALPQVAADQVRAVFGGQIFKESDLSKVIAEKRALLAVNAGGRAIVEAGPSNPRVSVMLESADKVQMGFNLMMGVNPELIDGITESELGAYKDLQKSPNLLRPRHLYQAATGDWDMHLRARSLREAATTSTYSNALGTSINLMLVQAQKSRPVQGWQNIVKETDSDNLLQQDRVIVGGFDTIPTVAEGASYTDLGNPKEYAVNYPITKRGGYYQVTEEAVINDRLGIFEALRDSVKLAGFKALDDFGWGLAIGNAGGSGINTDTSYDGLVHYHANHFNTSSSALSYTSLVAAHNQLANTRKIAFVTALNDGTDVDAADVAFVVDDASGIQPGSYFRIDAEICRVSSVASNTLTVVRGQEGTTPAIHLDNAVIVGYGGILDLAQSTASGWGPEFYVIVPTQLRATLFEILQSGYTAGSPNFNANYMQSMAAAGEIKSLVVPSSYLGGDTNNWYTAVPWQLNPGLELSYFNGQRAPQIQDETDLSGDNFLKDVMKFRIKFRFGGKALAHEGRTGNIVSGG